MKEALNLAEKEGLDLVEVAPDAKPPVCKLMDYGKFKYGISKKEKDSADAGADGSPGIGRAEVA